MNTALLIIDLQNDYFPGGKMELVGIDNAAGNAGKLLNHFRNKRLPVFHIQHISVKPTATFFLPDTDGVEINDIVRPSGDEKIIVKNYPNSFRGTILEEELKNSRITNLIICGAMSHMCIDATARAAFDLGFSCTVIHDACTTRDLIFGDERVCASKVHASFMSALGYVYAKVISSEEYLLN
jgi:nicotinamidase-related amidase